jgi:mannose-6-phosphate isomerase-like protein (cupin superfamily)
LSQPRLTFPRRSHSRPVRSRKPHERHRICHTDHPSRYDREPAQRVGHDTRWWVRLRGDDTVDVWLLTWVTDSSTDLHDHGESAGAFTVVSGTLEEVRPEGAGGELAVTALHTGDVRVIDRGVVHDVRSPSLHRAVSIHAYSPPLREMTFYESTEHGPRPTRTVDTESEALLP